MQNYPAALEAFETYLAEGGKDIPPDRRRLVEKEIAKLKQRLATIEVVVNVPDADIWLDEERVGTAPLASPLVVSAGRRKIGVTKPGFVQTSRQLELAGGDHTKVYIDLIAERPLLAPELGPASPSQPVQPARVEKPSGDAPLAPAPRQQSNAAIWTAWTATGVLATGTGVLAFFAWRAAVDLRSERDRFGTTADALMSKRTKVERLALVADIGLAATLATGGLTLVWTLSNSPRPAPESARLRATVSISSVVVGGQF
jgi:hypothetical protein